MKLYLHELGFCLHIQSSSAKAILFSIFYSYFDQKCLSLTPSVFGSERHFLSWIRINKENYVFLAGTPLSRKYRKRRNNKREEWIGAIEAVLADRGRFRSQSTELTRGPPELVQHFSFIGGVHIGTRALMS
jgi:hypothetical protein